MSPQPTFLPSQSHNSVPQPSFHQASRIISYIPVFNQACLPTQNYCKHIISFFVTPTTKLSTGACHSSRPSVLFMSEQMNSTLRDFPPIALLAKMLKGNSQSPPHALCPFAGCSVLGAVAPGTVRMCSSVCKPRHVSVLHERKFCDLAMCANMGSAIAHVVVCVLVRRIRPTAHSCGLVHTLAIGGAVAKVALFLCDFRHIIVQFA